MKGGQEIGHIGKLVIFIEKDFGNELLCSTLLFLLFSSSMSDFQGTFFADMSD
jgi:hypothetical protein